MGESAGVFGPRCRGDDWSVDLRFGWQARHAAHRADSQRHAGKFARQHESGCRAEKIQKTLSITLDTLADIESRHLSEAEGQQLLREKVAPALMSVSKCPDFVMDEGHYFKWFDSMTEEDKNALIELLKTF